MQCLSKSAGRRENGRPYRVRSRRDTPWRSSSASVYQVMTQAQAAAPRVTGSIISPLLDLLLVGGLSLIVFVPLLLSGRSDLVIIGAGAQAWLATMINMPHFMASYRIIY